MKKREDVYQTECGPEDKLYSFVYDFEPYSPGGRDEPSSGGNAIIYTIRDESGAEIPEKDWPAHGFDAKAIEKLEEAAYQAHCEREADSYNAAMEDKADAERERRLLGD